MRLRSWLSRPVRRTEMWLGFGLLYALMIGAALWLLERFTWPLWWPMFGG